MTDAEALRYAIDWLRAFPALPTAAPDYRERRAKAVERLESMLRMNEAGARVQNELRELYDARQGEPAASADPPPGFATHERHPRWPRY